MSAKSYQTLYGRESLVYVTQMASHEMREFEPSAVYMIGGFPIQSDLSRQSQNRSAWARTRRDGIAALRLPFHSFYRCALLLPTAAAHQLGLLSVYRI